MGKKKAKIPISDEDEKLIDSSLTNIKKGGRMKKKIWFLWSLIFLILLSSCMYFYYFSIRTIVKETVQSIVKNSSIDTFQFVEKYSSFIDELDIPYPEAVKIFEEVFVWSKFYDVNPDSVIVLIYVESGFNSRATGIYGEVGLFQIMPMNILAYYPNIEIDPEDLYDIHMNIVVGLAHWKNCLKDSNDDYDLARRYYNGGYKYAWIDQVTKYVAMHKSAKKDIRKIIN